MVAIVLKTNSKQIFQAPSKLTMYELFTVKTYIKSKLFNINLILLIQFKLGLMSDLKGLTLDQA